MPHYTLSFGRSSSPHYAAATALAAQIPGTTVTGGDGVAVHAVPLDAESLPALGALLELVVGWKRTALWRDSRRLPAGTLTHLRTVLACWRERETSGRGALHCQGWGAGGRSAVPASVASLPSRNAGVAPLSVVVGVTVIRETV